MMLAPQRLGWSASMDLCPGGGRMSELPYPTHSYETFMHSASAEHGEVTRFSEWLDQLKLAMCIPSKCRG